MAYAAREALASEVRELLSRLESRGAAVTAASSSSPLVLSGAVSNHLRVSTPDATYAVGLQGSDYRSREPLLSEFSIRLPDSARSRPLHWAKGLDMFLSDGGALAAAQETDGEEDDDYKHLTAELCRIYSHTPRAPHPSGAHNVFDVTGMREIHSLGADR